MRSDSGPPHLAGLDDELAQFGETFQPQFDQQRFMVGKVPVGRGMADAGAARHGPQGQGAEILFFQDGARRFEKAVAQIAVMIGAVAVVAAEAGLLGNRIVRCIAHAMPFYRYFVLNYVECL